MTTSDQVEWVEVEGVPHPVRKFKMPPFGSCVVCGAGTYNQRSGQFTCLADTHENPPIS